jgi:hypothetical protein
MTNGRRKHAKHLGYPRDLLEPIAKNDAMRVTVRNTKATSQNAGLLEIKTEKEWVKSEFRRKFFMLFKHYEIHPDSPQSWVDLAFSLVHDWIPGFEIMNAAHRRPGAPKKGDLKENFELVREIDSIIQNRKAEGRSARDCSVIAACREFKKRNINKQRWKSIDAVTIKNYYHKTKTSHEGIRKIAQVLMEGTANKRGGLAALGQRIDEQK